MALRIHPLYLSPRPTFEATQQQLLQMSKRQLVAATAAFLCFPLLSTAFLGRRRSISFSRELFRGAFPRTTRQTVDWSSENVEMCVFWPGREHRREYLGIAVLYLVN